MFLSPVRGNPTILIRPSFSRLALVGLVRIVLWPLCFFFDNRALALVALLRIVLALLVSLPNDTVIMRLRLGFGLGTAL